MSSKAPSFGTLLRAYRLRAKVGVSGKFLTQAELAEYLDTLAGLPGYGGELVSYWETGKRKPPPRRIIVGLLQVLKEFEGVHSVVEANELLISADYRPLDEHERQGMGFMENAVTERVSVQESPPTSPPPPEDLTKTPTHIWYKPLNALFLWSEADAHARSSWAGMLIWSFRAITDRITPKLFLIMWGIVALWGGTAWLITPLLQWPLMDPNQRLSACGQFAIATLVIPFLVGLFTQPDTALLKQDLPARRRVLFFLKLAGSYAGFCSFALSLFLLALTVYYLTQTSLPAWTLWGLAGIPLLFAHVGARRIPADRFKMYGEIPQMHAADRLVLVTYPLIGTVFAWYVYLFYDVFSNRVFGLVLWIAIAVVAYWKTRKT
ncbi:MAG: hypothetical protein Fur0022_22060 [Anaerolineales bacterium]